MTLTKKQEEGLRIAVERFNNGEPYTCIAGYASQKNLWTYLTKLFKLNFIYNTKKKIRSVL